MEPPTTQHKLTAGKTRQSRMGGLRQEMTHHPENSSISIFRMLLPGLPHPERFLNVSFSCLPFPRIPQTLEECTGNSQKEAVLPKGIL